MGFIGTKDTLLAQTKTDGLGNFQLSYPKKYIGAANLQVKEMTSLIVLLNNENFEITWADFKDFTGVQFTNSKENKTQVEAIDLENSLKFKLSTLKLIQIMFVNIIKIAIFVQNNEQMASKKQILSPKYHSILETLGENLKLARKRRNLTTIQVAERADIARSTLYEIEKGSPKVAMGAYFNVLKTLGLQNDFLKLASDDELGRKLQDIKLL
jgi:DNA-binding XRE family transcriptional regulator